MAEEIPYSLLLSFCFSFLGVENMTLPFLSLLIAAWEFLRFCMKWERDLTKELVWNNGEGENMYNS